MTPVRGSGNPGRWTLGLLLAGSAGLFALLFRGSSPGPAPADPDPRGASASHDASVLELEPAAAAGRRPADEPVDVAGRASREERLRRSGSDADALDALTEKEHHRALLAEAAHDPAAFARAAPALLLGAGPDCRKVACLRVLHETGSPASEGAFALALAEPSRGGPHGTSLREFALRYLGELAERDPAARSLLLDSAFGALRQAAPELRARAGAYVARTASELELHRLAGLLSSEEDGLFLQSVNSALAENPAVDTVDLLFPDLGVPRGPLALEAD